MTDHTTTLNESLWIADECWATIASFLDNDDLARFRQLCKFAQFVSSHASILQPLYNHLYTLDETLTPLLPQEGTLIAFKQAFEKIQSRQQFEISYLIQQHPDIMAKPEYVQVLQENTAVSLKSLEATDAVLDKINGEIITAQIEINSSSLDLDEAGITRFPITLFQDPVYANFWQNLTSLYCENNNELTALDVRGLKMLEELWCNNNQLHTLNVQGLAAIQSLYCENNQLTALNVQGLAVLQKLCCNGNPLQTLILTGVHVKTKNTYAELERHLLFNQLCQTSSVATRQAIIHRLGANYTYNNCLMYCSDYAEKLFAFDLAIHTSSFVSSPLSQASAFLPSFSLGMANNSTENTSLKRKRDENEIYPEDHPEESENLPATKKRKRK